MSTEHFDVQPLPRHVQTRLIRVLVKDLSRKACAWSRVLDHDTHALLKLVARIGWLFLCQIFVISAASIGASQWKAYDSKFAVSRQAWNNELQTRLQQLRQQRTDLRTLWVWRVRNFLVDLNMLLVLLKQLLVAKLSHSLTSSDTLGVTDDRDPVYS